MSSSRQQIRNLTIAHDIAHRNHIGANHGGEHVLLPVSRGTRVDLRQLILPSLIERMNSNDDKSRTACSNDGSPKIVDPLVPPMISQETPPQGSSRNQQNKKGGKKDRSPSPNPGNGNRLPGRQPY